MLNLPSAVLCTVLWTHYWVSNRVIRAIHVLIFNHRSPTMVRSMRIAVLDLLLNSLSPITLSRKLLSIVSAALQNDGHEFSDVLFNHVLRFGVQRTLARTLKTIPVSEAQVAASDEANSLLRSVVAHPPCESGRTLLQQLLAMGVNPWTGKLPAITFLFRHNRSLTESDSVHFDEYLRMMLDAFPPEASVPTTVVDSFLQCCLFSTYTSCVRLLQSYPYLRRRLLDHSFDLLRFINFNSRIALLFLESGLPLTPGKVLWSILANGQSRTADVLLLQLLQWWHEHGVSLNNPVLGGTSTVLHCLARMNMLPCIQYVLSLGVCATARDAYGRTALHSYVNRHRVGNYGFIDDPIDAIELLIKHGVDINAVDNAGYTALHYAASIASAGPIKELLRLGADPTIRALDGTTASSIGLLLSATSDIMPAFFPTPGSVTTLPAKGAESWLLPDLLASCQILMSGNKGRWLLVSRRDLYHLVDLSSPVLQHFSLSTFTVLMDGHPFGIVVSHGPHRLTRLSLCAPDGGTALRSKPQPEAVIDLDLRKLKLFDFDRTNRYAICTDKTSRELLVVIDCLTGNSVGSFPINYEWGCPWQFALIFLAENALLTEAELRYRMASVGERMYHLALRQVTPEASYCPCVSTAGRFLFVSNRMRDCGVWVFDLECHSSAAATFVPTAVPVRDLEPTQSPFVVNVLLATDSFIESAIVAVLPTVRVLGSLPKLSPSGYCVMQTGHNALFAVSDGQNKLERFVLPAMLTECGVWSVSTHHLFPTAFKQAVRVLLFGAHVDRQTGQPLCPQSPLHLLSGDMLELLFQWLSRVWFES